MAIHGYEEERENFWRLDAGNGRYTTHRQDVTQVTGAHVRRRIVRE